jgi:hypothetical protein
MNGIDDRRVDLLSHYVCHDGSKVGTIMGKDERYFLNEARGKHEGAPCLEVIARVGSRESLAERITLERKIDKENQDFWMELSTLLKKQITF